MKSIALMIGSVVGGLALILLAPVAEAVPVTVSPGSSAGDLVHSACPTFSWSVVGEGAGPYELVVYPVTGPGELGATPALRARLPAGAQSWTPAADACLGGGSRYAWTLREIGSAEWSEPALFEVAVPSRRDVAEALETLRSYLAAGERGDRSPDEGLGAVAQDAAPRRPIEVAGPGATSGAAAPFRPMSGLREGLEVATEESHASGVVAIHAVAPSTSGLGYGVWGESDSPAGHGVFGDATATSGFTYGVRGESSSTNGRGVLGVASAGSGSTYGVRGQSSSTEGTGALGFASSNSGATIGVHGVSWSSEGYGVLAQNTATSGYTSGVYAETQSTDGRAVTAHATPLSGFTYGVFATSESTSGTGVMGRALASTGDGYGVAGYTFSTEGGRGVYGLAVANSGTSYGVYGRTVSPQGFAGYFDGAVVVTGSLSKGGGSFKIDHPLDPANKYLSHSFVESPDMMNVYNGNVVLDEEGEAWIVLPEYFGTLNRDFRYQLTALYRPAPRLHVARGIEDRRFRIAGGEPGMEVSWMVTGIRRDAFAEKNRIVVEEDKGELRGRYLHPEVHGQPAELAIGYVEPPATELAGSSDPPLAGAAEGVASTAALDAGSEAP